MPVTRAAMRLLIPDYLRAGISANQFIKDMKNRFGFAYRRTNVLSDFRYFGGIKTSTDRIKNVRKDRLPSDGVLAPGTPKGGAKYEWRVKLSGYDPYTGAITDQYVTILGDNRQTPADIEQIASDTYNKYSEEDVLNPSDLFNVRKATLEFGIRKV